MLDKALEGIKVVELASVLAGPAVGMFLAELGAEVIKVENRAAGGDMTRSWKLRSESPDSRVSAYFSSINYGKRYLAKDLRQAENLSDVIELIATADILINNMKSASAKAFGLDHASLKSLNPKLIQVELSGFAGENAKVGFDIVLQAETGFLSMTGSGQEAAKLPVALIDVMAAHQMKEGVLLALFLRERDGRGSHIRCSLEEASLASLANQATNYLMGGQVAQRMGTLHPNIAPYGEVIRTADGVEFVLAIGTDRQFQALCEILGLALHLEARFASNPSRVKHRTELSQMLRQSAQTKAAQDLESRCDAAKVPIGRIRSLDEVLESNVAHDMILHEEIEGQPTKRLRTVAFHMAR